MQVERGNANVPTPRTQSEAGGGNSLVPGSSEYRSTAPCTKLHFHPTKYQVYGWERHRRSAGAILAALSGQAMRDAGYGFPRIRLPRR